MRIKDLKFEQAVKDLIDSATKNLRITTTFLGKEWQLHLKQQPGWPDGHLVQGFIGTFGMVSPNVKIEIRPLNQERQTQDLVRLVCELCQRWKYKYQVGELYRVEPVTAAAVPEKKPARSKKAAKGKAVKA